MKTNPLKIFIRETVNTLGYLNIGFLIFFALYKTAKYSTIIMILSSSLLVYSIYFMQKTGEKV